MRRWPLITAWRVLRGRQSQLIRRADRVDAAVRLAVVPLVALVAVGAALVALVVLHNGQFRERAQLQTLSTVQSTVVSVDDVTSTAPADPATTSAWDVQVKWRNSTGAAHRTSFVTLHEPAVGDRLTLWLDPRGRPVPSLWNASDSRATAIFGGLGVLLAGTTLLGAAAGVTRRGLARRRLDEWAADWERVAPTWTSR